MQISRATLGYFIRPCCGHGLLGCEPTTPSRWRTPDRRQIAIIDRDGAASGEVVHCFKQTVLDVLWREAANHFAGKGLEAGNPSFQGALVAKRILCRLGRFDLVSALECVIVGGASCGSRWARMCARCGGVCVDDPAHRYYECPDNAAIEDSEEWLSSTAWVGKFVRNKWASIEVMWARAIAPASVFPDFLPERPERLEAGNFSASVGLCDGVVYTDGSGGPRVPQIVAQAGSAIATCKASVPEGDFDKVSVQHASVVASAVPGNQTVPRGEAFAICSGFSETIEVKKFGIDATYAIRGLAATQGENSEDASKLKKLLSASNGDLWQQALVDGRRQLARPTLSTKIKSHSAFEKVIDGSISLDDFLGNALADAGAEAIAKARGLGEEDAKNARQTVSLCKRIALRLALIEARCRGFRTVSPPTAAEAFVPQVVSQGLAEAAVRQLVADNNHVLAKRGAKVCCMRCGARHALSRPERWLQTPCNVSPEVGLGGQRKRKLGQAFSDIARRLLANQGPQTQVEEEEIEDHEPPAPASESTHGTQVYLAARASRKRALEQVASRRTRAKKTSIDEVRAAWDREVAALPSVQPAESPLWNIHGSHALYTIGGFFTCCACGSTASTRLRRLAAPCAGHLPGKGAATAMRSLLMQGKLPASWEHWPDGTSRLGERLLPRPCRGLLA